MCSQGRRSMDSHRHSTSWDISRCYSKPECGRQAYRIVRVVAQRSRCDIERDLISSSILIHRTAVLFTSEFKDSQEVQGRNIIPEQGIFLFSNLLEVVPEPEKLKWQRPGKRWEWWTSCLEVRMIKLWRIWRIDRCKWLVCQRYCSETNSVRILMGVVEWWLDGHKRLNNILYREIQLNTATFLRSSLYLHH